MSKNKNKNNAPRMLQPGKGKSLGEDMPPDEEEEEDEDFDPASDQVPIVCLHHGTVKFNIAGRKFKMKRGDIAQVEGAYGTPRVFRVGADALPSVVELETGRKVLPVADPRVDKDSDGTPLVVREAMERRQQQAQQTKGA